MTETQLENLLPEFIRNAKTYSLAITDLNGNYSYVNEVFKKRFSFINIDFIGQPFWTTIHPEDVEKCNVVSYQCITNPTQSFEIQVRKPSNVSNDFYWTHWEFSLLKDQNGRPIGILCLGYDITENEKISRQLKYSETMLRALYDSSSEAITFIDKDFFILFTNKLAKEICKRIFGKEPQIGDKCLDYIVADLQEEFADYYQRVLQGETIYTEKEHCGSWWAFSLFPVYDNEKNIIGISDNVKDITMRKENELKILKQNETLRQIAWQQSHELRRPVANILGLCELLKNYQNETKETKRKIIDYMLKVTNELDEIIHKIVLQADKSDYNE
ncbi:MAG: PAS domain S-box protein [Microscillaceae bacterium]|jgi:PAS domain S-box-containing protein|nr:PAS domain S-box protein [Microscillaceae bacterium]